MKAAMRWYLASLLLFWGSTAVFVLLDFATVRWFDVAWPSGPDLFPNQVLGIPLAFVQLMAAGVLVFGAWKMAVASETHRGAALRVLLAASTAAACFVTYALFGLWYQFTVMHRPM